MNLPVSSIPADYCYNPLNLRTEVTGNLVTFMWESPHANDGFYLTYSEDNQLPITITVFGLGTQLLLIPNVIYNWSVRTMCNRLIDRGSDTVLGVRFETTNAVVVCPTVSIENALIINAADKTRLQWTNVLSGSYEIEICVLGKSFLTGSFTSQTNHITFDVFAANTEYQWRVRPVCNGAEWSKWGYFKTGAGQLCPAVEISTVFEVTTGIIYWKQCPAATSYQVYVNNTLIAANHPVNVITLQNLNAKKQYDIIVIPNCETGAGDMATHTVMTLGYKVENPINLFVANENNNLIVTWEPNEGATYQEIMINGSIQQIEGNQTSYVIAAHANLKYAILIRTIINDERSTGAYTEYSMPDICGAVKDVEVSEVNHQTILLKWSNVTGVTEYKARYRNINNEDWISVRVAEPILLIENLNPGIEYIIEISTICNYQESSVYQINVATSLVPMCPIANITSLSQITVNGFYINFIIDGPTSAQTGNFRAIIKRNGFSDNIIEGVSSPIHFNTAVQDTQYTVTVQNICNSNPSISNPYILTTPKYCQPPINVVALMTTLNTVLSVSWNAIVSADSFQFIPEYRPLGGDTWTTLPKQPGTSFTANLAAGIYAVRITTAYDDGRECLTQVTSIIPKVLNLIKTGGNNPNASLIWDAIQGVDGYNILLTSLSDNDRTQYEIRSATDIHLLPLATYSVTVKAISGNVLGTASNPLVFTTNNIITEDLPNCIPPAFDAFQQDSSINDSSVTINTKIDIQVTIKQYSNNKSYKIELIPIASVIPIRTINIDLNVQELSGIVLFPKEDKIDYYVKVTETTGANLTCYAIGQIIISTCTAPTGLTVIAVANDYASIAWNAVINITKYEVYLNNEFYAYVSTPTVAVVGLIGNGIYKIKVRSVCSDLLTSAFTTEVPFTVPLL